MQTSVILFSVFITFPLANAFFKHLSPSDKAILNDKIRDRLPEIVNVECIVEHDNLDETLDGFLKLLEDDSLYPLSLFHIFDSVYSIAAHDSEATRVAENPLANLLPPPSGEYLSPRKLRHLYPFMQKLALSYVQILKQDFQEEKEIHVIPIGWREELEGGSLKVLFGVLGKRKGSRNNLKSIARVLADFQQI
ncbi:hypothetical protein Ddc_09775 [Ditylenchus destructor]|nr:hypothetical protein Ddc_09775 [Ditylenchus destructor]